MIVVLRPIGVIIPGRALGTVRWRFEPADDETQALLEQLVERLAPRSVSWSNLGVELTAEDAIVLAQKLRDREVTIINQRESLARIKTTT